MAFAQKLLKEASRQNVSRLWALQKRRSEAVKDSVAYTFFRSRGFLVRRLSRGFREFAEAFGIALVASPLIAASSLKLWILQLVLMSVVEGIYQALKGSIIDFRKLSRGSVVLGVGLAILLIQAAIAVPVFSGSENFQAIRFLFVMRALSFLVEVMLGSYYFDITSKLRVFIPPQWALVFAGLSIASVAFFCQLKPQWALIGIITSHCIIRVWDQWVGFKRTRAIEKQYLALQKPLSSELKIESEHVSLKAYSRADLKRIFVWSSLFIIPVVLSLALKEMSHARGAIIMWTLLSFMIRVTERPFRAFSVDMVDAMLKHQWFLVKAALASATRSSLVLSGIGIFMFVAFVASFYSAYLPLIALLLVVSSLQRIVVNSAGSVGLDKDLFWTSLIPRMIAIGLFATVDRAQFPALLVYFVGLEFISAIGNLLIFRNVDVAQKIESVFVNQAIALTPQPKYLPVHFLTTWKTLSLQLKKHGLAQINLSLQLSESYRSPQRMEEFLIRVKDKFRPGDLVIAVSSQRLVLWLPGMGEDSFKVVKKRFLLEFALEIEDVTLLSDEQLSSALLGPSGAIKHAPIALESDMIHKILSLQWSSKDIHNFIPNLDAVTGPHLPEGRWWMRDSSGTWISRDGATPSSSQIDLFFRLEQQATGQVFLHKPVHNVDLQTLEHAQALRPFGALLAIFVTPAASQTAESRRLFEVLNASILRRLVESPSPTSLELGTTRFNVVSALATSICKRYSIPFSSGILRGKSEEKASFAYTQRIRRNKVTYWALRSLVVIMMWPLAVKAQSWNPFSKPLSGKLYCAGDRPNHPLTLESYSGDHHIVDLNFSTSPFVPAFLACNRWLTKVRYASWYDDKLLEARPLVVSDLSESEARLTGPLREKIYASCAQESYCKVNFPFRWLAPVVALKNISELANPILDSSACQQPMEPKDAEILAYPELKKQALKDLKDLKLSFSPLFTLADAIETELERAKPSSILLASTLNFSSTQLLRLSKTLSKYPDKTLILFYDFNPVSAEGDLVFLVKEKAPPNLKLLPIFGSPKHRAFFHFKGMTNISGNGHFYFSSSNLKSNQQFKTFDLGFEATNIDAARSMAQLFLRNAEQTCREGSKFLCSLEARYDLEYPVRWFTEAQVKNTCEFIKTHPVLSELSSHKYPDVFFSTADWNAVEAYKSHISSAKESLEVSTHILNESGIIEALEAAHVKGIKTEVVLGKRGFKNTQRKIASRFPTILSTDVVGSESHTKAILADETRLIWGTGNLTHNGLVESSEYFFYTEEPALIAAYKRYIQSFRSFKKSELRAKPAVSSSNCLVWVPAITTLRNPKFQALAAQLTRSSRDGFYFPSSATLQSCLRGNGERLLCSLSQAIQCFEGSP